MFDSHLLVPSLGEIRHTFHYLAHVGDVLFCFTDARAETVITPLLPARTVTGPPATAAHCLRERRLVPVRMSLGSTGLGQGQRRR